MYRSNTLIQSYAAHNGAISKVAWHPSGNFLLSSSLDSTLKVWDVREGQLFYTLHGHEGAVGSCCFSPAGDFFASAGCDEQVMVWKTNFDRHLDDYVLTQVHRGDTELQHESQPFPPNAPSATERPPLQQPTARAIPHLKANAAPISGHAGTVEASTACPPLGAGDLSLESEQVWHSTCPT